MSKEKKRKFYLSESDWISLRKLPELLEINPIYNTFHYFLCTKRDCTSWTTDGVLRQYIWFWLVSYKGVLPLVSQVSRNILFPLYSNMSCAFLKESAIFLFLRFICVSVQEHCNKNMWKCVRTTKMVLICGPCSLCYYYIGLFMKGDLEVKRNHELWEFSSNLLES